MPHISHTNICASSFITKEALLCTLDLLGLEEAVPMLLSSAIIVINE